MTQTTSHAVGTTATVRFTDDSGATWLDLAGSSVRIEVQEQSRTRGSSPTLSGGMHVLGVGKRELQDVVITALYTPTSTEAFRRTVDAYTFRRTTTVTWETVGTGAITTATGRITAYTWPSALSDDASPLPIRLVLTTPTLTTSDPFRALLQANATYAWLGDDLPTILDGLSSLTAWTWPDVVAGEEMTPITTQSLDQRISAVNDFPAYDSGVGGVNGVRCAGLTLAAPFAIVHVATRRDEAFPATLSGSVDWTLGTVSTDQASLYEGAFFVLNVPFANDETAVFTAVLNGASSSLQKNTATPEVDVVGGGIATALGINAIATGSAGPGRFNHALVAVVAGDNYLARAALIRDAAIARYL